MSQPEKRLLDINVTAPHKRILPGNAEIEFSMKRLDLFDAVTRKLGMPQEIVCHKQPHTYTPCSFAFLLQFRQRRPHGNVLDPIIELDTVAVDDTVMPFVIDCEIGINRQLFACLVINHRAEQRLRVRRSAGRGFISVRQIGHHVHANAFGVKIMARSDPGFYGFVVQHSFIVSFPKGLTILHGWQRGLILLRQIRPARIKELLYKNYFFLFLNSI